MMKKKILLAALFSVTAVLAAVGLATEKSNAKGWYGDDPIWMETGETLGYAYDFIVECTMEVGRETFDDGRGSITTTIIKQTRTMHGTGCSMVSTQSCNPYSPC